MRPVGFEATACVTVAVVLPPPLSWSTAAVFLWFPPGGAGAMEALNSRTVFLTSCVACTVQVRAKERSKMGTCMLCNGEEEGEDIFLFTNRENGA